MARHPLRHRMPAVAPGALRHARSLQHKTKTPYRIVYEQVTEKKKTLIKEIAFSQKAPRGYTFIPAGDPQITNRCKEIAREDGEKVFIVTTSKPRAKPNRKGRAQSAHLAHEVHRVGYHFPSLVVEKACMSLGISLSQSGQVLFKGRFPARDIGPQTSGASRRNGNGHGLQVKPAETEESQAALDAQARETIKDLFPKIPDKDLQNIVRQAFKKNTNRVGTAVELPLPRRVQLAVVAHIRHVYTNYDRLLRIVSYPEARARVEKPCLDLLAQWRSDDDDDANAMEDILREVIVIDDDDDDDQEDNVEVSSRINRNDREASVEIISSRTFATRATTQAVDHSTSEEILPPSQQGSLILHGRASTLTTRDRQPPFTQHLPEDHTRADRNGIYHNRWKEALHRRRMHQEPVLTIQQDPMMQGGPDRRGYLQSRDDSRLQMLALNREHSYTDQATGAIDRRPRERSDYPGQVHLPAHHQATLAIDSRPLSYVVSDRETEVNRAYAVYNQRINPSMVPPSESLRLMRQTSNEQESRKDTHNPRIYYLPSQVERVLPSVEGAFRNATHRDEVYYENDEFNKHEPARRERQNPRLLNLGEKMGGLSQNYRAGDRILLPTENIWQTSRDFHEESIRRGSHPDAWSVSHQNYAASMHPPRHVVKHSRLLGPAEAKGYSGLLRPAQDPAFSLDGTRQPSQERIDRQNYSVYNEQFQAPYDQSSLLGQGHVLRKPAYVAVESSRSIPAFHYSQKQLPVLHGSSSPYDSAHKERAEHRYEPLGSSRISTLCSSDGRNLEASQGMHQRFTDLTISPENSMHHAGDVHRVFEGSRQAYLSSRINGPRMHTSERPQASIFLRKVGDDRYAKPEPEKNRSNESESSHPHGHLQRVRHSDPGVFHGISNEQNNRIPIMEPHKRANIGWAKDEYRQLSASYDQPGLANPYHSADWYRRRDAPHTSTNLEGIRSYPGEIIIID